MRPFIAAALLLLVPGSKTDRFMKAAKVPAHIPLSGKTMEFDANGKCTAGC